MQWYLFGWRGVSQEDTMEGSQLAGDGDLRQEPASA